jgi:putative FmdB family regulatory protein
MPIYEYECGGCGHKLEVLQRISDAPLEHCPACEQDALRKLVSAAGFQLKGTGWYVTDFRDKGKQAAKKTEDGGEKTTKTEDKPAAASDTASTTSSTTSSTSTAAE